MNKIACALATIHKRRPFNEEGRWCVKAAIVAAICCILPLLSIGGCGYITIPAPNPPQASVNMLYDDDCDKDIDCAITQPILHHWIDLGYAKVWGLVSSAHSQLGAPTLRVFRDYYGHSNLFSIGAWTPACEFTSSASWNIAVVSKFDPGDTCTNYENCGKTLRESVARYIAQGGGDNGIDYVITGPLTCEEDFRNSLPDTISPLTGAQLEQRYIRQFIVMNGSAPSGSEYNCLADVDACSAFFTAVRNQNDYPPVYVVPNSMGALQVVTEVPVFSLPQSNPTSYAFRSEGIDSDSDEDALAVEYAIYGATGWKVGADDTNIINASSGSNAWTSAVPSGHYYLAVAYSPEVFERWLDPVWLPSNHF